MSEIKVGKIFPDFSLMNQAGEEVKLSDFRGKKIVLYFYPRDNTPGCTTEACDFRDAYKKFQKMDTIVIGVSPDTEKSHQKFADKFELPFMLLADPDKRIIKKFNLLKEKNMYGKKVMGVDRSTYIIDEAGYLVETYRNVKVEDHVKQVLARIAEL